MRIQENLLSEDSYLMGQHDYQEEYSHDSTVSRIRKNWRRIWVDCLPFFRLRLKKKFIGLGSNKKKQDGDLSEERTISTSFSPRLQMYGGPNSERFTIEILDLIRRGTYLTNDFCRKILGSVLSVIRLQSTRLLHVTPVD